MLRLNANTYIRNILVVCVIYSLPCMDITLYIIVTLRVFVKFECSEA